ncbi:MAG: rRNA ((966)-N(2))-methyltransferase RsmD [Planctomycetota bacterium]|jgi:16S rRNA (guanine(966)-N(2))-methyltransferase RsmD
MTLKVIAGIYGSRILKTVPGMGTRPLLGQVRGSLFNILAADIPGAVVWDLFAGTGASGIEALSRGAERVLYCEKNGRALDILRGNLQTLGGDAVQRSVVMRADAWEPPPMTREVFGGAPVEGEDPAAEVAPHVVFFDPPYPLVVEDPARALGKVRGLVKRLAKGGCLVFHFPAGQLDEDDFDADTAVDLREWGTTAVALLWRAGEEPERVRRKRAERATGEGTGPDPEQAGSGQPDAH